MAHIQTDAELYFVLYILYIIKLRFFFFTSTLHTELMNHIVLFFQTIYRL